ncbi:MAG: hypothetical protein K5891_03415 [Lachnospiraceae bacterium]|nr:hypothetical protein [Lachnospiraceae bacterium]
MAKSNDSRRVEVCGYSFAEPADATLAESERKKIEYLKTHLDSRSPETVLVLYRKAVNEKLFKTPVGIEFLRELQDYLINQADYSPEEVPAIPLYLSYADPELVHHETVTRRVKPQEEKGKKISPLFVSVVLNLALAAGVGVMFWIASTSDNPNIINYENAVTNRYSSWDQELTQREETLRERERNVRAMEDALGIDLSDISE